MPVFDQDAAIAALDRLVTIAQSDTGQSARVANFLLAWWNAGDCGGVDLTDLWNVDRAIADDRHPGRDPADLDSPRIPDRVRLQAPIRAARRRLAAPPVRPARSWPGLVGGA